MSGRPALSSQDDVRFVSSSGQSVGRHRSRSPKPALHGAPAVVHMKVDNVATVPRCPVGQDGVLPVDHIGCMNLGGGTQLLYIAYTDTVSDQLWSHALNIGKSDCIVNLVYVDCEVDSVLCQRVRSALSTTGSAFAGGLFMCTEVGDFVAVGIGSNTRKRTRSSRVAAAVCFELQAKSRVDEFHYYAGFRSLIKQVRSCFNLHVP